MRRSLSCQVPVKYRVLGVAAMRPLQQAEPAGATREGREFGLQLVARTDVEARQPTPQAGAEPPRQALLAAESTICSSPPAGSQTSARATADRQSGIIDRL